MHSPLSPFTLQRAVTLPLSITHPLSLYSPLSLHRSLQGARLHAIEADTCTTIDTPPSSSSASSSGAKAAPTAAAASSVIRVRGSAASVAKAKVVLEAIGAGRVV